MTDSSAENLSIHTNKLIGLSKVDEERMIKEIKRYALKECREIVEKYVECAQSTFLWLKCKPLAREMNACVKQYTTEEYRDKIRLRYLKEKEEQLINQ